MPETITISDPRYRTKSIFVDLKDPNKYIVTIKREVVRDVVETGAVFSRNEGITIRKEIIFDGDIPSGSEILLPLLEPIEDAVSSLALEANELGQPQGNPIPSNNNEVFGEIQV